MTGPLETVAITGALGLGAQWCAWRFQLPAIVLMALAGLVAGPALGVIDPRAAFGDLFGPMVTIAVAIILFEGGLSLDRRELTDLSSAVRRLVTVGAALAWGLGTAAAHLVAGLSLPVAIVFAGVLIVTGPTVVMPLLRQAGLATRPAAVLKWEGIVADPIGALAAVFAFEAIVYLDDGRSVAGAIALLLAACAFAAALGWAAGWGVAQLFRRGLAPEFLKAPIILVVVLACFAASDAIAHETGLLAVTVMGIAVANAGLASIEEMRRFKETVTILLVSGVFVLLTATLTPDVLALLDWRAAAFVAVMLVVVRPAAVWISTIGVGLSRPERTLIGWIAPRGIVAVAVSGVFGEALVARGYPDGALMTPLAFAMVFATVVLHGFSIRPAAHALGLARSGRPGVLIVGVNPWSVALASALKTAEIPVLVADASWARLREARRADIPYYYGEILSEATEHRLDLEAYAHLVAVTHNDAYNALVCSTFAPEVGRRSVFQTGRGDSDAHDPHALSRTIGGRTLTRSGASWDDLHDRLRRGFAFQRTRLTEKYDHDAYLADRSPEAETILIVKPSGAIDFATLKHRPAPKPGDTVIAFGPPVDRSNREDG